MMMSAPSDERSVPFPLKFRNLGRAGAFFIKSNVCLRDIGKLEEALCTSNEAICWL